MLHATRAARPTRALAWGIALAGLAAFAWLLARVWPFTVDDTYITLRYARHVAQGLGLNWNPGATHAEGYTSLAWTLLLAVPHALGLDAVLVAKVLGVALALATAATAAAWAWSVARGETAGDASGAAALAAGAAAGLYLAMPATAVHAASGMETALGALVLTALLALAGAAVRERGERAARTLPAFATLLAFTRPEGVLAGALALACVLALRPRDRRRQLERAGVAFALPLLVSEFVRVQYYHLPLPLPFYVKLAHPGRFAGAGEIGRWLGTDGWRLGLLSVFALVRPPRALWPALAVTAALALFFTLPQHLMGYQHRYVAPCDPTLAVLAGVGLARLVRWAARWPRIAPVAASAGALAALAVGAWERSGAGADIADRLTYESGMAAAHLPVARALESLGPGGRLVLSDAGSIPYFTDWPTRDLVGLNDPRIAVTARRDPADVLEPAPTVIALVSLHAERFAPWDWNAYETPILAEALRRGYAHVATRRFAADYWLWLLAKPGSREARALEGMR